jgi:ribosome-associated protein
MIEITPSIWLNEDEIKLSFIHSTGPGGQNVNKLSTAVQLRFNVNSSASIPEEIKQRLARLAGRRMTSDGVLIIDARQHRTQEQNRLAAIERLSELIRQASLTPRTRHKTRPSRAAALRRLEAKRKRGIIKRMRQTKDING